MSVLYIGIQHNSSANLKMKIAKCYWENHGLVERERYREWGKCAYRYNRTTYGDTENMKDAIRQHTLVETLKDDSADNYIMHL